MNRSLFVFQAIFNDVVKPVGHAVGLVVDEPVPPLRVFLLEVKVWLCCMVDSIRIASKRLDDVKRVSYAGQDLASIEGEILRHDCRMVGLDNPNPIVDNVFSFEALYLKSGRCVQVYS